MYYAARRRGVRAGRRAIYSAASLAPPSTQERLIFPLNMTSKQFVTTSYSTQWAQGRISLQEVRQVLANLQRTKAFNSFGASPYIGFLYMASAFLWFIITVSYVTATEGSDVNFMVPMGLFFANFVFWVLLSRFFANKNREVFERETNMNMFLQSTDAKFEPRGFRFRAGNLGAWVSLTRMQRPVQVPPPQNYGMGMGGMGMAPTPGYGGYRGVIQGYQGGRGQMAKNGGGMNYPQQNHANYPSPGDNGSTHAF